MKANADDKLIPFSTQFDEALRYASALHRAQARATSNTSSGMMAGGVPYIGHLLGVAGIVIDVGGTEDEAIAALLHDAAEDQGGEVRLLDICKRFNKRVADIVRGCSDALTIDRTEKPPWRERKERYIAHLRASSDVGVYLVSAADKCNNARATARDLAFGSNEDVWSKFNPAAGAAGTLWYYDSLRQAYWDGPPDPRRDLIVSDLTIAINEIRSWCDSPAESTDELPF